MGKSIISTSFQLAIPRQVALPQSLPPLHQPAPILKEIAFAVQFNSSERRTVSQLFVSLQGTTPACIAVAHSILKIVYHMLKDG